MPGSVLLMAPLGQPIAKGKARVLPSGPWVAINGAQVYLPPCLATCLFKPLGAEGLQKSGQVKTSSV